MCGISAIFKYSKISESDTGKLKSMNSEMSYRGPDENGIWADEKCGMAHTRLSIIGLKNGKQPVFNEDRTLVLICNGEIYNYVELKNELIKKGHRFSTDGDSETILHLYEEYGIRCLEHLRGMFAFCLWNSRSRQLFSARDRVGEKTLYYSQLPEGIIFSTELKAISRYFLKKKNINISALAETIRYNYPHNSIDTYIEEIKRLPAGHYALADDDGFEIGTYWRHNTTSKFSGNLQEAKTETLNLLKESVNICMRSDVPVGVLLSSGIDSSAIAALAKESGREVHVITAGYRGQHACDERTTAKRFAKEKNLVYHEVELDVSDFENIFHEYIKYIDEPVCDLSSIPQWALYKKAKALGFTVLLGGLGGDELFYGYPYWNNIAESLKLKHQHQALFPWKGKKMAFLKFLIKNYRNILYAGYPYKINDKTFVDWTYEDYLKFASNAAFIHNGKTFSFKDTDVHYSFEDGKKEIDQVYQYNFSKFMPNLCLYLADRLGMGNAVEIRSPLIDHKLVEFVSSIPAEFKYRKGKPKYFLKEVLQGIVPDYIINAPKSGFTPPLSFIRDIVEKNDYTFFNSETKFFNSILADRMLSLNLK